MNWKLYNSDSVLNPSCVPRKKNLGAAAAGIIAAGISAAGSIAGSAIQNNAASNLDWDNREWQEKIWHMTNAYNAPVAQRKRLEAAGINPALAMQDGGSAGVAAQALTPNAHQPADWSGIGAGISNAVAQYMQFNQMRQQNALLQSQTTAQDIDNQTLMQRKIAEWEKLLADKSLTDEERENIKWQIDKDMYMLDLLRKKGYAEIQNLESQSALNNVLAQYNSDKNYREAQMLAPTIEQLQSIAKSNNSMALLNQRNANIVPRLSNDQLEQISQAFVDEKLKNASAEEIAGFKFSGTTIQELKTAVKSWLKSNMW